METYVTIAREIDVLATKENSLPKIAELLADNSGPEGELMIRLIASMSRSLKSVIYSEQLRNWPEKHAKLLEVLIPHLGNMDVLENYPCGLRDITIAKILEDQSVSKNLRVHLWRAFVMGGTKFIRWKRGEDWNVPDVLQDHPSIRNWICSTRQPGWNDLRYSDRFLFKEDVSEKFKTDSEQQALKEIRTDSPAGLLMPLDIDGIELDEKYYIAILAERAMKITLYLYNNDENFRDWLSPRHMLFYICANWNNDATIPFVTMLEKDNPGLVKSSIDDLGHDALWYTLYQRDRCSKATPAARCATDPLDRELIRLGCDPDRKNVAGLSYNDLTEKN